VHRAVAARAAEERQPAGEREAGGSSHSAAIWRVTTASRASNSA
jgi:hypothetical protein